MKSLLLFFLVLAVCGCLGEEMQKVEFLTDFTITEEGCVKTASGERCKEILHFTYEGSAYSKTLGWIEKEDCELKCGHGISEQALNCMEQCRRREASKPKPSDGLEITDGKVRVWATYNTTSRRLTEVYLSS